MSKITVAAIQFPLQEKISEEHFFKKVETFLDKSQKCDLIIFPELFTTELINMNTHTSYSDLLKDHAINFYPQYLNWITAQAIKRKVNILGGTIPRMDKGNIYNTAMLVLSDGTVLLQDKLFLTPDEKSWNLTPGNHLHFFETNIGRLTITICFDCEIPEISNLLVSEKPELILVPSWTSSESGLNRVEWTSRARAVEHYAYVVKTSTVPGANMTNLFGQASIISPQETGFPTEIIHGPMNKGAIVIGEINLSLLRNMRKKTGYYPALEQSIRKNSIKVQK